MRLCFFLEPLEPRITFTAGFIAADEIPGGSLTLNLDGRAPYAPSALFLSDGGVLVSDFHLVDNDDDDWCDRAWLMQFNRDGTRDLNFGDDGIADVPCFDEEIVQLLRQPDRKILAMTSNSGIFRFDHHGRIDRSFTNERKLSDTNYSYIELMQLTPTGEIILAGSSSTLKNNVPAFSLPDRLALFSLNANGTRNLSFGIGGAVADEYASRFGRARFLTIQPDGKILVNALDVGDDYALKKPGSLLRFNSNGTPDETFGLHGRLHFSGTEAYGPILLLPNGKIIQVLNTATGLTLLRLNRNGTVDRSFGENGRTSFTWPEYYEWNKAFLQPDGKMIIISRHEIIARFNADGTADSTFGFNGSLRIATASGRSNFWLRGASLHSDGHLRLFLTRDNCVWLANCKADSHHLLDITTNAVALSRLVSADGNFEVLPPDPQDQWFFLSRLAHARGPQTGQPTQDESVTEDDEFVTRTSHDILKEDSHPLDVGDYEMEVWS